MMRSRLAPGVIVTRDPSGFHGFGQRRIVDIAAPVAAEKGIGVRSVHRCAGLQARDEIRVGQHHLAIGFQFGEPRGYIRSKLVTGRPGRFRIKAPVQSLRMSATSGSLP